MDSLLSRSTLPFNWTARVWLGLDSLTVCCHTALHPEFKPKVVKVKWIRLNDAGKYMNTSTNDNWIQHWMQSNRRQPFKKTGFALWSNSSLGLHLVTINTTQLTLKPYLVGAFRIVLSQQVSTTTNLWNTQSLVTELRWGTGQIIQLQFQSKYCFHCI